MRFTLKCNDLSFIRETDQVIKKILLKKCRYIKISRAPLKLAVEKRIKGKVFQAPFMNVTPIGGERPLGVGLES
ncbi:MAG TPA: hypothetical protein DDY13_11185 [Cytophagales bacterium]|nr:hypothetical protein [Cytophagales bacterium]